MRYVVAYVVPDVIGHPCPCAIFPRRSAIEFRCYDPHRPMPRPHNPNCHHFAAPQTNDAWPKKLPSPNSIDHSSAGDLAECRRQTPWPCHSGLAGLRADHHTRLMAGTRSHQAKRHLTSQLNEVFSKCSKSRCQEMPTNFRTAPDGNGHATHR